MDRSDIHQISNTGHRYPLVVVGRATKFLSAFSLAAKVIKLVIKCLLKLFLAFGVPHFLRSDAGGRPL